MKNMKKLASLLLALVMVLSLATTAFAAMEGELTGGSITITNPVEGQTYSAYQILYLESYNEKSGAYSYKANSAWEAWLKTQTTYVAFDDQGYVTWVEDADAAAFAKLCAAQLTGKTADGTATAGTADADGKVASVTISDLKLGYYLVDTTLGTVCGLTTTKPAAQVTEKNEAPTSDKQVQEDSDSQWGTENDADIGQTVNYKSEIGVKAGAVNYTFRDTMTEGLTLNVESIKVQINGADVAAANYTLKTGNEAGDYTFTIAFDNTWIATQTGKTIVITYSATLNEKAVIAGEGNKNTADLEYGNKPVKDSTPDSTTTTKTWKVDVEKFTYVVTKDESGAETKTEKNLAGATFTLSKKNDGSDPIKFIRLKDADGKDTNTYRVAKTDETNTVTTFTTDATGKFTLQGLDSGTYYLTETAAPAGYNKLAGPVTVVIDENGKVNKTEDNAEGVTAVKVENKSGSELPSTGGVGTTIFYTLGGILMLAAVVLLVTKKRMSIAE